MTLHVPCTKEFLMIGPSYSGCGARPNMDLKIGAER